MAGREDAFAAEIKQKPIDLPRAALRLAKEIAYPRLDIPLYLAQLDQLTDWARAVVQPGEPAGKRARDLADFLFRKFAFQGNTSDYQDPRNSFLNEVLDRRLGIPITLSILYLAIARRLDLPAQGIGLPGHFIVRVETALGDLYLDPFHGGQRLEIEDCARLVSLTTGYEGPFRSEWLDPVSPELILVRLLTNLKVIYVQTRDWEPAAAVIEHLLTLQPKHAEHLRDLGLLYYQTDRLRLAARFLESYLLHAPEASDFEEARGYLQATTERLAQLN